jgi:hypothetical protein
MLAERGPVRDAEQERHPPPEERHGDEHRRRRPGDVAAEHVVHPHVPAGLEVTRLLRQEHEPGRRREGREAGRRRLRVAVIPCLHDRRDRGQERGAELGPRGEERGGDGGLDEEAPQRPAVVVERLRPRRREAPEGRRARDGDRRGREHLRDHDPDHRAGDAPAAADRDARQPQPHREREEGAADVVAPAEDDRPGCDRLRRLHERDRRGDEHRHEHAARAPDVLREGREHDEGHAGEQAADQLEAEREPEEPPQPAPPLGLRVAEPVLDQRLLDREVEEHLEERRRREHGRELRVVVDPELARRDNGREEPEPRRRVDPERRRRASPEGTGAHRCVRV